MSTNSVIATQPRSPQPSHSPSSQQSLPLPPQPMPPQPLPLPQPQPPQQQSLPLPAPAPLPPSPQQQSHLPSQQSLPLPAPALLPPLPQQSLQQVHPLPLPLPLPQHVGQPATAPGRAPSARAGLVARWLAWRWSGWTSPLLLLALWSAATSLGWAPEQILVSPLQVLHTTWELIESGELRQHLEISVLRLAGGFAIGAVAGIGFGLLLGLSPGLRAYTAPTFNVLRQLPSVALIPLFILLFGIGESFKIFIVVKATFFIVALAVHDAVAGLSERYIEVARVYGFTRWQIVRRVVLPGIVPATLTGVRIALSRSWMVLVGAELLAADSGLGQMMEMARQMFRLDIVMVGVVLTGGIGYALDRGLRWLEAHLMRWQRGDRENT